MFENELKRRLEIKKISEDYIEYEPLQMKLDYEDRFRFKSEVEFDQEVNKFEYKMFKAIIKQLVHKFANDYVNQRQIIYTGVDCISLIQIVPGEESHDIFIHQRSMEVNDYGINDMLFFIKFFDEFVSDYTLYYTIAVPHEFIK